MFDVQYKICTKQRLLPVTIDNNNNNRLNHKPVICYTYYRSIDDTRNDFEKLVR